MGEEGEVEMMKIHDLLYVEMTMTVIYNIYNQNSEATRKSCLDSKLFGIMVVFPSQDSNK